MGRHGHLDTKKPTPKLAKENRCVWTNQAGNVCGKLTKNRFFCEQHFATASRVEACSFGTGSFSVISRRK